MDSLVRRHTGASNDAMSKERRVEEILEVASTSACTGCSETRCVTKVGVEAMG